MDKRLFLIDGHALIFKMYYAFMRRPMINTKGVDTSILYGFTRYLLELVEKERPTHLAVAFDPPAKTFRHEIYPEYKANRMAAPELVKEALEPLCQILEVLDIPVFMVPGYEADDVIGTIAKNEEKNGFDVYMVTPDKDYGQLISPHIFQFKPGKSGSENELVDCAAIREKYGIERPEQVVDILTVWGDASDNVKGVDGVGEVGAKKLVGQYGSVENIYSHISELKPKMQTSFEAARDHIEMSKFLVTIKTDVPVEVDTDSLVYDTKLTDRVKEIFAQYEFGSLLKLLGGIEAKDAAADLFSGAEAKQTDAEALVAKIRAAGKLALATTSTDVVLASGSSYSVFPLPDPAAKEVLEDASIAKTGFDIKSSIKRLREAGVMLAGHLRDIEIMHYVINPERTHKLDILAKGYLGVDLDVQQEEETVQGDLFAEVDEDAAARSASKRACNEAAVMEHLAGKIGEEMAQQGVTELYENIEEPLIQVLADMEYEGVRIDVQQLRAYGQELGVKMVQHEQAARDMAGEPTLNLSSVKQVGRVLYEKLELNPKVKKSSKENYPTDEQTLLDLSDKHPIINELLEYRAVKKLQSTYIDPLPGLINPRTGKIHTTFNQALTSTGRLSSVKPNLQNIPVRTERGREIRKAFIPSDPQGCIIAADYSQIELRLMAHCSGDEHMTDAFNRGMDIHTATAAKVFHTSEDEVSKEQRRRAKVANFGIIYGISAFGLSQRMGIPRGEAKQFIEQYFANYPAIKGYMDSTIELCRERGYVETIFGRKRYLPDITSRNANVRGFAERNAINAPIQGSAADIIKMAMVNVWKALRSEGLRSRMVLQVHDELVFDVVAGEKERLMEIVKREMESVCKLSVPLIVDCSDGANWLEAH